MNTAARLSSGKPDLSKLSQPWRAAISSRRLSGALSSVLSSLLVCILGYQAANLSWQLLSPPELTLAAAPGQQTLSAVGSSGRPLAAAVYSVAPLQQLSLFGQPTANSVADRSANNATGGQAVTAPPTRLRLKLLGVMAGQGASNEHSLAIIEYQGQQTVYAIGDTLPAGGARLSQVLADRVLIEHQGMIETLSLSERTMAASASDSQSSQDNRQRRSRSQAPGRTVQADSERLSQLFSDRSELLRPSSLAEHLRIRPLKENGRLRGYQLSAGRSPALFNELDLQAGDLVTRINGLDLTKPGEAIQAMGQLSEASDFSIVIERQGEQIEFLLSLPQ